MASKRTRGERADREGAEGQSSHEGSDLLAGVQPKKSLSTIMREQATRADIKSTSSLVAAYNRAESEEEEQSLHQWLQRYSPYLDAGFAKHAESGIFEEMSCLADIKPRCEKDEELIRKTIFFLGQQVEDITLDQRKTAAALAAALQAVDESAFNGDVAALLKLSSMLLNELDTTQTAFIEATHKTHSMTLFALHQALLIVQSITASVSDTGHKQQWCQVFKRKLKNIADCQSHFPSLFQVKIVEQCLERIILRSPKNLRDIPRRMMSIMSGCCHLYSGGRKALSADIDLNSLAKGWDRLKEAIANDEHLREWYDEFLKLNGTVILISEKKEFDDEFTSCFQGAMEAQAKLSTSLDANLLRFGIVAQLSYTVLRAESSILRQRAMTELVLLGTKCLTYEGWDKEPAIIDAILAALQNAHSRSSLEDMAETAVLCMKSSGCRAVRECVEQWLNGRTIKDKLREHANPNTHFVECRYLFNIVARSAGFYSNEEQRLMVEELTSTYQSSEFSKIPGLLEEQVENIIL